MIYGAHGRPWCPTRRVRPQRWGVGQGPHFQLTRGALGSGSSGKQAQDPGGDPRAFQRSPSCTTGAQKPPYQPTPPPLCRATQVAPRNAPPTKFCTAMSVETEPCQRPRKAASPGQGLRDGWEQGRATAGTAEICIFRAKQSRTMNKCPTSTVAPCCLLSGAKWQVQRPRGTEDKGIQRDAVAVLAQMTKSVSPTLRANTLNWGANCKLPTVVGPSEAEVPGRPTTRNSVGRQAPAQKWNPCLARVSGLTE